jgi:hypothetical protein
VWRCESVSREICIQISNSYQTQNHLNGSLIPYLEATNIPPRNTGWTCFIMFQLLSKLLIQILPQNQKHQSKGRLCLSSEVSHQLWQHGFDSRPGHERSVVDKMTKARGWASPSTLVSSANSHLTGCFKFINHPHIWYHTVSILSASMNIQPKGWGWGQGDILKMLSTYRFYAFVTNPWSLYQIYGMLLLH